MGMEARHQTSIPRGLEPPIGLNLRPEPPEFLLNMHEYNEPFISEQLTVHQNMIRMRLVSYSAIRSRIRLQNTIQASFESYSDVHFIHFYNIDKAKFRFGKSMSVWGIRYEGCRFTPHRLGIDCECSEPSPFPHPFVSRPLQAFTSLCAKVLLEITLKCTKHSLELMDLWSRAWALVPVIKLHNKHRF